MLELCKPSIKNQKIFFFFLFLISFSFNVLAQPPPIILNTTNETTTFQTTTPFVKLSGGVSNITNLSLNDLLDVSVPSPSNGNFLRFSSAANEWLSSNTTSALHSLNGTTHTGNLSTDRIVKDTGTSFLSQLLDSIIDNLFTTKFNVTGGTITGNVSLSNNSIKNILSTHYSIEGCTEETTGTFCYDPTYDTMRFVTESGQILQMNQENTQQVKNLEGTNILDGSIIYLMGATGDMNNFKLAKADNLNTSGLLGVLTKDCNNNQVCPAVFFATVHGLDTTDFVSGDHLYLSEIEAGNFTTTPPEFPNVPIWIATALRIHPTEGTVFVFPKLDSANGITINSLGLIGDIIQTDYKIRSQEGHANMNGKNVFTIIMNGTTGEDVPHLVLQPGGVGQASILTRSFLVVPENLVCLNNTNRTDAQCWADAGGFTWSIADFNTTNTEGADVGITGELEVIKNLDVHGNITAGSYNWTVHPDNTGEYITFDGSVLDYTDNHLEVLRFFDGMIIETINVTICADSQCTIDDNNVKLTVQGNPASDLTADFSSGFVIIDTTPPVEINLTAGSNSSPQLNYVYVLESTSLITTSTGGFPNTEFAPIAVILVPSVDRTFSDGVYKLHAWTDHSHTPDMEGHLSHINSWVRTQPATWSKGIVATLTLNTTPSPDSLLFSSTSGSVLQLHLHNFPAINAGHEIYVVNDFTESFKRITDLNEITSDSDGDSLTNKKYKLVIWGSVGENDEDNDIFLNLPSCSYTKSSLAFADSGKCANFNIPSDFTGVGFLIAAYTIANSGGGNTLSIENTEDLRGLFPSISAGGNNAFVSNFADNAFTVFDESDGTKIIDFQINEITTGNTRTITWADRDLNFSSPIFDSLNVNGNVTLSSGAKFWSNSTCAFISSPDGSTVQEICNA